MSFVSIKACFSKYYRHYNLFDSSQLEEAAD